MKNGCKGGAAYWAGSESVEDRSLCNIDQIMPDREEYLHIYHARPQAPGNIIPTVI
jgi:hypothetical protein